MTGDMDVAKKALVSLVIEKSLLEIGKPLYDNVVTYLEKEHDCFIPDCYEHPEYLVEVLKKLYGNAYRTIVKSINEQLEEFSYSRPITRFLEVIAQ